MLFYLKDYKKYLQDSQIPEGILKIVAFFCISLVQWKLHQDSDLLRVIQTKVPVDYSSLIFIFRNQIPYP